MAELAPTTTPNPHPTRTLLKRQSSLFLVSGSAMPTASDSAPGGNSNDSSSNSGSSGSLVNYYFGFLALIVCAVALCIFIVVRRRHRLKARLRDGQDMGPQNDGGGGGRDGGGWTNWNPERRHHWHGRWRSTDVSREEGLNEYGEAPPAYVPKTSLEEREERGLGSGPAVPLQTLSRDGAGLKPPDYSEEHTETLAAPERNSPASASAPRAPEARRSS